MMKSGESLEWVIDTLINESSQKEEVYERKVLPRMYSARSFTPDRIKMLPSITSSPKPWRKTLMNTLALTPKRTRDTRILGFSSPFGGRYKS